MRHRHVMGWVAIPALRPRSRSWAWGCVECGKPIGKGAGTIRYQTRYMAEEDVSIWGLE